MVMVVVVVVVVMVDRVCWAEIATQLTQVSFQAPEPQQIPILLESLHALPLPDNYRYAFLQRVCARLLA
jgi:hypothetical protein